MAWSPGNLAGNGLGHNCLLRWPRWLGPELAVIVPGLLGMPTIAVLCRFWEPIRTFRVNVKEAPDAKRYTPREVIAAWSSFYIFTGCAFL
ncbi:L-lactate permease [Arthrobacter sp. Hz1]